MNEKVENLILEHLRAMRADMTRMADQMATMQAEMTATRQQVAGIVTLQDHDHTDIAALKARLERIEQRLDLID
jgi:predicted  nucleic acid-binding Zn-ribbon protein